MQVQGLTTHIADPRWSQDAVEIECPQLLVQGVVSKQTVDEAAAMVQPGETVRLISPSWRHVLEVHRETTEVVTFHEYLWDPFEKVWDEMVW